MSANNIYSDRTLKRQAKRRASEVYFNAESDAADVNICLEKNAPADDVWSDAASDWPMSYESDELETEFNVDDNVIDGFWSNALTETDSSDDEFVESAECLGEELRGWAIDSQIPQCHLNGLLGILRKHHPYLPKDARTLLGTPTNYEVQQIAGGTMHYFGIEKGIRHVLNQIDPLPKTIHLQVNIDGLPLFKSSNKQFWPILGLVEEDKTKQPFVIALYLGSKKPENVNLFLESFVNEYGKLKLEGVDVIGKCVDIKISNFVCDASARAFVKNIKAHNAYHGCEKCTQEGTWLENRMTFPEVDSPLRTDTSFINKDDEFHHKGTSVLTRVGIGMVSQFPLDVMHLVFLGVVRKLIGFWMRGPLPTRLGAHQIGLISAVLMSFAMRLPREFARKGRSLVEVDRWKATEFRTFLLYTGPVALKDHLPNVLYHNFMLLHVAIRILCCPSLCLQYCDFAEKLLITFVEHFQSVYGNYVVYNIHGLTHLANDARQFGVLHNFAAFPFENFLYTLKKLIRTPTQPLQQIIRRLSEKASVRTKIRVCNDGFYQEHKNGPFPYNVTSQQFTQYKKYVNGGTLISLSEGDNYILFNGDIYIVKNILKDKEASHLVCLKFQNKSSFFTYPIDSSSLDISFVKQPGQSLTIVPTQTVSKVLLLQYKDGFVAYPLLHTA